MSRRPSLTSEPHKRCSVTWVANCEMPTFFVSLEPNGSRWMDSDETWKSYSQRSVVAAGVSSASRTPQSSIIESELNTQRPVFVTGSRA